MSTRTPTARSTCSSTSWRPSTATWWWSATTTSPSTGSAARTCATSSTSARTIRTRMWSAWSRTTAHRRPFSTPPTASSAATRSAPRRSCGPTAPVARRCARRRRTTRSRRRSSWPTRSSACTRRKSAATPTSRSSIAPMRNPARPRTCSRVDALGAYARDIEADLLAVLTEPARVPNLPRAAIAPLRKFRIQLESLRSVMGVMRPSDLIDHVIEVLGLKAHYLDGTPQGEARMENLNELRGLAESFDDRSPDQGLEDFLAEVALVSDVDAYDENGEGVTLITLHMVKGLEFPVVFMVGMEAGLLPHQRALDEREENPSAVGAATEMAEERRLAYVGMTRAKDRLYLSCAFRRHLYGRSQPAFPSRFLTEIPQSMLSAPRGSAPVAPPRQGYKERYQELQVQAAPAPPPVQRFSSGDRVSHPAFGAGVVVKSTLTRTDEELVIKFDKVGLKILSGMIAPLTK